MTNDDVFDSELNKVDDNWTDVSREISFKSIN